MIRLARNLRNQNQFAAALAAYGQAAEIRGAAVGSIPVDLLARWARCDLLARMNRQPELKTEARALRSDLLTGRWQIGRPAYDFHIREANGWIGDPANASAPADTQPNADAVEQLWKRWQQRPARDRNASGREAILVDGTQMTILWEGDSDRFAALVAGPAYVEQQWVRKLAPMLDRQHVRVGFLSSDSRDHASRIADNAGSRRSASETGLPWTVAIESTDLESELKLVAGRRTLWLAGLAMLAALVIAGSYLIARAVMRELAVARLQSDFVAAVSHEFRTPLTTLRQLTEILIDSRITAEERRHTYYHALARQTERLHRLVESLLDFGRMEAGASPYRLKPLDACAWVRTVVEEFGREADGRGYRLELDLDGAAATIAGDREALTSALWNLLDNAVKYSLECARILPEILELQQQAQPVFHGPQRCRRNFAQPLRKAFFRNSANILTPDETYRSESAFGGRDADVKRNMLFLGGDWNDNNNRGGAEIEWIG